MDPAQLAGGNVPPQMLAALQSQAGGMDITGILAQLAQMSPDEVSAALQQLGVSVDPNTLHAAAEQWVENAGDRQTGGNSDSSGADDEQPTAADGGGEDVAAAESASEPSAPASMQDDETAETTPDDEQAEGEPTMPTPPRGAKGVPVKGGSGPNMDALISAAMSQGDPESMPPPIRGGAPNAGPNAAPPQMPAQGQDPRLRAMLAGLYKQQSAQPQPPSSPRAAAMMRGRR